MRGGWGRLRDRRVRRILGGNAVKSRFWADKHRVRRSDSRGHFAQTIAMCENSTVAKMIVAGLNKLADEDISTIEAGETK